MLKHEKSILAIAIILYITVMTGLSWWKLETYRYNAIDLAYYNQAMWRTVHGDLFGLTIHPHKTLGDHIEPILPLFVPFYALFPHTLTRLLLQSLALGIAAVPLFLIARLFVTRSSSLPLAPPRRGGETNVARPHPNPLLSGEGGDDDPKEGYERPHPTGSPRAAFEILGYRTTSSCADDRGIATERHDAPLRAGYPARSGMRSMRVLSEERRWSATNAREGQPAGGRAVRWQSFLPLLIALLWLINPLVHNANLFEFHILPFAIAPILFAFLAFERRDLPRFILWSIAAMMVREDVPLIVGAFAILGAIGVIQKERTLRWIIAPLAVSIPWFVGTQALTHLFSSDGSYKFFVYYAWMGESAGAILHNLFVDPVRFVRHIADFNLLLFFLELGIPFLFLFFLRPRALIVALPALLPHLLASYRVTPLVAETHYVALLLPGVAVAGAAALIHPPRWVGRPVLYVLVVAAALYAVVTMSPVLPILRLDQSIERSTVRDAFVARIPHDAAVATTESFLTALSGRAVVVFMRYVYAGATQYGKAHYALRPDISHILLDLRDVIAYDTKGTELLARALQGFGVIASDAQFVLLARGAGTPFLADAPVTGDADHQERVTPCPVGDAASCVRLTMTAQPTHEKRLLVWGDALLPLGYNLVTDPPLASTYWLPDHGGAATFSVASWTALQTLMPDRSVSLDYHLSGHSSP